LIQLSRCLFALLVAILPAQLGAAPARRPAHKATAHAPVPMQDWSTTATRLPSGAFLWGNPGAKVKLVEYLSLTCPHCAHFEKEAIPPFTAKYLRPGLASYEVRHALRDGFDYAGSLLARCDGPRDFFATIPKVFAQQESWFARAQAWSKIESAEGQTPEQLLPKLARGAGFDTLFGMTLARIDSCLANHDEQTLITAQANEAWRRPGMEGTPAFMINDQLRSDIEDWHSLDVALARALHLPSSPRKTAR